MVLSHRFPASVSRRLRAADAEGPVPARCGLAQRTRLGARFAGDGPAGAQLRGGAGVQQFAAGRRAGGDGHGALPLRRGQGAGGRARVPGVKNCYGGLNSQSLICREIVRASNIS